MNRRETILLIALVFVIGLLFGASLSNDTNWQKAYDIEVTTIEAPKNLVDLKIRNVSYPPLDPGKENWPLSYTQNERFLQIPLNQAALVLIDVWETVDEFKDPRIHALTEEIIRTKIRPLLFAARRAGLYIIHAPHRSVDKFGRNRNQRVDFRGPKLLSEVPPDGLWPPAEFRYRIKEFTQFARNSLPGYMPYPHILGIHPLVSPDLTGRELIESRPDSVAKLLREQKILHLFYAGFATNMCVLSRDIGIRKMAEAGYNTILIRDATLGTEFDNSIDDLLVTKAATIDTEINYGFTTLTKDLLHALGSVPNLDN